MGADDDAGCTGHVWRLSGVALMPGGAQSEYVCARCETLILVGPDDIPPETI
jgi:hypothetical protein